MKRLIAFFLFSLFFCSLGFSVPLSLAELIDMALKNSPETEKAWAQTKRAQAALGIAKSKNYPTLDATGTLNHMREVKFPSGPNTVLTNYGAELCLSYLLFDFGERSAAVQAAKESLYAANWAADFSMQQIICKVTSSYYEYLNAKELLQMQESSLKDGELIAEAAEELYKRGLRSVTDMSTSKAAVAEMRISTTQQNALVAISYGKLLTSIGVPIDTLLEVESNPEGIKSPLFSEGITALISLAEKERKDLLAKEAMLAKMEQEIKKENRAPLPKLRALGQGGWLQYTKHQGNGYNYTVGVALDIPIFKGFEYTYRKQLALANEKATAAELRELYEVIALEVLTYSESVKAAELSLRWSEQYIEEALKAYESSLENYKAGLQNIFDLLQAEQSLARARIKKTEVKTKWLVSLAELAFATGSIIR